MQNGGYREQAGADEMLEEVIRFPFTERRVR